ncbi:hypothetical protein ACIRBY_34025 [Streptomyces sp. NPDC096136]|uniref:hypothetical protein n=1 Tax=Streptomyces sp. NPDC096136 TaxID=3366076 RepID=UPI0037FEA334
MNAASTWSPTAPLLVVADLLPLPPATGTAVSFTFDPLGAGPTIDDVHTGS